MRISILYTLLLVIVFLGSARAQVPVPAGPQEKPIVLTGGTAHIGNGKVVEDAVIGLEGGKIAFVTEASQQPDLSKYEKIDISGRHVYPGLILPNSQVGLREVSAVRAMNDYSETGELNPNVRALVAYNTDSEVIPTLRVNGVLLVETTPGGGLISGRSSVMELDGWDWEDAVHTADVALHLSWPNLTTRETDFTTFTWKEVPNKNYKKHTDALTRLFMEASEYAALPVKERNLKLEAMQEVFSGSVPLMIHADEPKEIVESVLFAKRFNVPRIVLVGGQGAYPLAGFLKEHKIPVILSSVHTLPQRPDDDVDLQYKLPHLLAAAGVTVCLSGEEGATAARNLAYYAGSACAYGMDREEALKMITSNTATVLGIDARVGTLEAGKDATLFVSAGDVMDYRTSTVELAFIRGKRVSLQGRQEMLFERYSEKYGHD